MTLNNINIVLFSRARSEFVSKYGDKIRICQRGEKHLLRILHYLEHLDHEQLANSFVVTPHDPIVEPKNETRERLSIESNFVIADQNSMSGQIIYTSKQSSFFIFLVITTKLIFFPLELLDFDEADPLNLNSVKSNPTLLEHNDSISISSINESNEMRIMETDSETTSSSDTGLFITEGLIFESIPGNFLLITGDIHKTQINAI